MFKTMMKLVLMLGIVLCCGRAQGMDKGELEKFNTLGKKTLQGESNKHIYENCTTDMLNARKNKLGEEATEDELTSFKKAYRESGGLWPKWFTSEEIKGKQFRHIVEHIKLEEDVNKDGVLLETVKQLEGTIASWKQERKDIEEYLGMRKKLSDIIKNKCGDKKTYGIKTITENPVGLSVEKFQDIDNQHKSLVDMLNAPEKYKEYTRYAGLGALASGCALVTSGIRFGLLSKGSLFSLGVASACVGLAAYFTVKFTNAKNPGTHLTSHCNNLSNLMETISIKQNDINNIDGRAMMANYMSCKQNEIDQAQKSFKKVGGIITDTKLKDLVSLFALKYRIMTEAQ